MLNSFGQFCCLRFYWCSLFESLNWLHVGWFFWSLRSVAMLGRLLTDFGGWDNVHLQPGLGSFLFGRHVLLVECLLCSYCSLFFWATLYTGLGTFRTHVNTFFCLSKKEKEKCILITRKRLSIQVNEPLNPSHPVT